MSTVLFQARKREEKILVRINPAERDKIIEDPLGFLPSGKNPEDLVPEIPKEFLGGILSHLLRDRVISTAFFQVFLRTKKMLVR